MTSSMAAREVPPPLDSTRGMVAVQAWHTTAFWRKSRASTGESHCVHVNTSWGHIWVRDSKNPRGPMLRFTRTGWMAFIAALRHEECGRPMLVPRTPIVRCPPPDAPPASVAVSPAQ
jgi:hypothetical protein